jgi:hypothetical protein
MTVDPNRREALGLLATVGATTALSCIRRPERREPPMSTSPSSSDTAHKTNAARTPSIFLAHGSPILLTDAAWMAQLATWARALPRPKAVLMLSAHWLDKPVTLGATTPVPSSTR